MKLAWYEVTVPNGGNGEPLTRTIYASSQSAAVLVLHELPAAFRGQYATVKPGEAPAKPKVKVMPGLPRLTEDQKPAWMKVSV